MMLGRPSLGSVMHTIQHLLLHLAVTFKHWERNFSKFQIFLGVVIWWQHSLNTGVKLCLLLVVSLGCTAGNQSGISWPVLENLLRVSLAAIRRQVPGPVGALWKGAAFCSAENKTACSQHWLWTASPKERSIGFSSYWITLMPCAERVSAFYK